MDNTERVYNHLLSLLGDAEGTRLNTTIVDVEEGYFVSGPNLCYWAPDYDAADFIFNAILQYVNTFDADDFTFTDLSDVKTTTMEELLNQHA
jgi:hypothetical protein